jgi:hypothetical protein
MGDRRRTSPSDALVDRARDGARAPDVRSGEFRPTSPADAYFERLIGKGDGQPADRVLSDGSDPDVSRPDEDGSGALVPQRDAPQRDATAIAAELLDVGQISDGAEDEDPRESSSGVDEVPTLGESTLGQGDRWSTSTSEWERREAKRRAGQQRRVDVRVPRARIVVSLAVIGFIVVGLVGAILDDSEPIADASVGDCFVAGDAIEIEQVSVVDCSQSHDSELFARVDLVSAFGTTRPGDDELFDWLFEECLERFPGYTGEAYEESRYWIDMFIPTSEAWSSGDHTGMCTLVVVDEDLEVVSSTGSGRSAGDSA